MEYDRNMDYKSVIYFLLNSIDKTYYIGRSGNIKQRIYTHINSGLITENDKIFILENNNIVDMEYVWLNYFSKVFRRDYKYFNKSFNSGNRFKVCGKTGKIVLNHIKPSNYYKFCKRGVIEDTTNLIDDIDEEIILLKTFDNIKMVVN